MLKFIEAEDIINVVKNDLSSYFESNLVDESILYPHLKNCLDLLGSRLYTKSSVLLEVKDFKATLPYEVKDILSIAACTSYQYRKPDIFGKITYEKRICEVPICKTECDYCHDDFGRFQVIQQFPTETIIHKDIVDLKECPDQRPVICEDCDKELLAQKKLYGNSYKLEGNVIHLGFETGSIFLEVVRERDELVVPDIPEIRDWITEELTMTVFKRIWYNQDGDAYQRYKDSQQMAGIKKYNALNFWRRFTQKQFEELKKYMFKSSIKYGMMGTSEGLKNKFSNPMSRWSNK